MHHSTHDRAHGTVAALVVILTALAVVSTFVPPLNGLAVLALVLGVAGLAVVARAEGVAR